jgi:hypothetical protein
MRHTIWLLALALAWPAPAAASDYTVTYTFPASDQAGLATIPGTGFAACGGGIACRSFGALGVHAVTGVAIPAHSTADILFTRPAGTTIAGGSITLRYRVREAGLHARLLWSVNGAYRTQLLPDHTGLTTRRVAIPAGATRAGLSLFAARRIGASAVGSVHDDEIVVQRLSVLLRDLTPPRVALTGGALGDGAWHARTVCGTVAGRDSGLGVYAVTLAAGGTAASRTAPAGTRLQPRPRVFGASLCLDTTKLHDGLADALLGATDGVTPGGNRAPPVVVALQVDNTAPLLVTPAPSGDADPDDQIAVRAIDPSSGVDADAVTLQLDGTHVAADGPDDDGWIRFQPDAPLGPGSHRVEVHAGDLAGNAAVLAWTFAVEPPVTVAFAHVPVPLRPGPGTVAVLVRRGTRPLEGVAVQVRLGSMHGSAVTDGGGVAHVALDVRGRGAIIATAAGARASARIVLLPGISLRSAAGSAGAGARIALAGLVAPARTRVVIEAFSHGAWHRMRTLRARADGRFRTGVTLGRRGLYVFRATARGRHSKRVEVWAR